MLTINQGKELISLARSSVKTFFENRKVSIRPTKDKLLRVKRGVFVTLLTYPKKELRGCIGFPYPELTLVEAVQKAALSSAFQDTRFMPINKEELERIVFEVSVLSEPEQIICKPKDYEKNIRIGEDGLIIQRGYLGGLLLPQVPVEQKWGCKEFLENICYKAGLSPDMINDEGTRLWKFQAQIFAEEKPNGEVAELEQKC